MIYIVGQSSDIGVLTHKFYTYHDQSLSLLGLTCTLPAAVPEFYLMIAEFVATKASKSPITFLKVMVFYSKF